MSEIDWNDFIIFLNKHRAKLQENNVPKDKKRFVNARKVLRMSKTKTYIINPIFEITGDAKKTYKEKDINVLKNLAKNLNQVDKKNNAYIHLLFNDLNKSATFRNYFKNHNITEDNFGEFADYLNSFQTENEKIISQQNKRIEEQQKEINDLEEEYKQQTEKIKEEYKEELKKETEKINNDYIQKLEAVKGDKKAIEILNRQKQDEINELTKRMEEQQKEAIEQQKQQFLENKQKLQDTLIDYKHRTEERSRKQTDYDIEQFKKDFEEIYGFAPGTASFIKQKIKDQAYSLDKDQLIDVINKAIENRQLPKDANPVKIANAIYTNGAKDVIKRINRISNLAILTGYNHDLYNKLPGDVARVVQQYISDKIQNDIRRKNIKYILPKDKPRWEHAMETKKLNPMLGRSAWRVN